MLHKISRLFTIKTKWEAYLIIYSLATGAMERGKTYLVAYPGYGGWLLFAACSGAVFMGGAKILDAITMLRERGDLPTPQKSGKNIFSRIARRMQRSG